MLNEATTWALSIGLAHVSESWTEIGTGQAAGAEKFATRPVKVGTSCPFEQTVTEAAGPARTAEGKPETPDASLPAGFMTIRVTLTARTALPNAKLTMPRKTPADKPVGVTLTFTIPGAVAEAEPVVGEIESQFPLSTLAQAWNGSAVRELA